MPGGLSPAYMIAKPYVRGGFRAVKTQPRPEDYPNFWHYEVQAKARRGDENGEPVWVTIEAFDYLGNARLRVRNLHAACCAHFELGELPSMPHRARRYIKTGK
jgi:hypothetical protein